MKLKISIVAAFLAILPLLASVSFAGSTSTTDNTHEISLTPNLAPGLNTCGRMAYRIAPGVVEWVATWCAEAGGKVETSAVTKPTGEVIPIVYCVCKDKVTAEAAAE